MADEQDKDVPSLEAPSLFGRRRTKKKKPAPPAAEPQSTVAPTGADGVGDGGDPGAGLPTETVPSSPPPAEPVLVPAPEPAPEPVTIFEADPEPTVATAGDLSTVPLVDTVPSPPPPSEPAPAPQVTGDLEPKAPREPWLTGRVAAAATGLLVGLVIVAATSGGEEICTKAKGTSSCGNAGILLLIAVLVVGVLAGSALLRAARVPDPGSTSFLAVGLLSIFTLLFLVGEIFDWWMIIAIPVVAVATYLLSHYVTTTYIEPADG